MYLTPSAKQNRIEYYPNNLIISFCFSSSRHSISNTLIYRPLGSGKVFLSFLIYSFDLAFVREGR